MAKKATKNPSVSRKAYLTVFLLFISTVLLTGFICYQEALSIKNKDRDTLLSEVAQMIATLPQVRQMVATGEISPTFQEAMDKGTECLSQIDLIVICNTQSIRLYHTKNDRIGNHFIGGDEEAILTKGEPYISIAEGSLGLQRRAFHAVRDESGEIIGFVMTSVLNSKISHVQSLILRSFLLPILLLFLFGIVVAAIFQHQLETILLGYPPAEFANLYVEQIEVLNTLEEGVIAVDTDGKTIVMNRSAKQILNLNPDTITEGKPFPESYPESPIWNLLQEAPMNREVTFTLHGKSIIASSMPVHRSGRMIGTVSIFRNRTEIVRLAEKLTGSQSLVETLRSTNHEFMNKLHVILGLIEMKDYEAAKKYIVNTSLVSAQAISDISQRVPIASLAGILIGKMLRARELGINLILKQDSYFLDKQEVLPQDCLITLVGNLIENAMDELNSREFPLKQIEIGIYSEEGNTTIVCDDSGGGIPEEILFTIYDPATTTKGTGHGNGFRIMKDIVDRYEGTFHIDTELGEGTSIEINLPV